MSDEISASELIAQAQKMVGAESLETYLSMSDEGNTLLAACESFYMNGCADDQVGSVDRTGHVYRCARWTVETDSAGFKSLTEHGSSDEADSYIESFRVYGGYDEEYR